MQTMILFPGDTPVDSSTHEGKARLQVKGMRNPSRERAEK